MPDYMSPSWTKIKHLNYGAITDEQIDKWRNETLNCERSNRNQYDAARAKLSELMKQIEALCGKNSTPARAVRAYKITEPRPFTVEWNKLLAKIKVARDEAREQQARYEAAIKRKEERRAQEHERQEAQQRAHEKRHEAGVKAAETRKRNEAEREEYVNSFTQSD